MSFVSYVTFSCIAARGDREGWRGHRLIAHSLQHRPVADQPGHRLVVSEIDFLERHQLVAVADSGEAQSGGAIVVSRGCGFFQGSVARVGAGGGGQQCQGGGDKLGLAALAEGGAGFGGVVEDRDGGDAHVAGGWPVVEVGGSDEGIPSPPSRTSILTGRPNHLSAW